MLITCPECSSQISDKALSCPTCGLPLRSYPKTERRAVPKRMKLPNGFGRITEIKNKNLRKPYRAMISDGFDDNGRPIGRLLKPEAYFQTYNEAYQALMKYHENPYSIESSMTMNQLYEKWFTKASSGVSEGRRKAYDSAWKYCYIIHDEMVRDVRTRQIKNVLENGYKIDTNGKQIPPTNNTRHLMKSIISMMFDYAVEYEIIPHNYVKDITSDLEVQETKNPHHPFDDEEFKILYKNRDKNIFTRLMVIQSFMGWRPQELLTIKNNQVDLSEWYIVGGLKTEAGKNRSVPIHPCIRDLIQKEYKRSILSGKSNLFLTYHNEPISYYTYKENFAKTIEELFLNPDHRPHDCRKHFVTMAKKAGVDEYTIKRIVGHSVRDLTERAYTERDIKWLHKELLKIKPPV